MWKNYPVISYRTVALFPILKFCFYFVSLSQAASAQKHYPQTIKTTDKEIIALNQIADMFLETKNLEGKEILIQIEFEAEYNTDKEMDRRILHYESFVDFDQQRRHLKNQQQPERELLTQVFYLRRSPKSGRNKPLMGMPNTCFPHREKNFPRKG